MTDFEKLHAVRMHAVTVNTQAIQARTNYLKMQDEYLAGSVEYDLASQQVAQEFNIMKLCEDILNLCE